MFMDLVLRFTRPNKPRRIRPQLLLHGNPPPEPAAPFTVSQKDRCRGELVKMETHRCSQLYQYT